MAKKYFIRTLGHEAEEVTHEEYCKQASNSFIYSDVKEFERIMESSKKECPYVSSATMFWVEFPDRDTCEKCGAEDPVSVRMFGLCRDCMGEELIRHKQSFDKEMNPS